MSAKSSIRRRRSSALALASLLVGSCGLLAAAGPVGAATDHTCSGTQSYNNLGIELSQIGNPELSQTALGAVAILDLSPSLAPGQYSITTTAFDGYLGRSENLPGELSEKYYLEFLDSTGAVVGATGTTPELADDVDYVEEPATFVVTFIGEATQVRFVQVIDFINPGDLVHVGCLGVSLIIPPTTTTSTTETPSTATTVTPPTTVESASPTTVASAAVLPSASTVTAPTRTLPVTGSTSGPLAGAGLLLVVAGAALLVRIRTTN